MYDIRFDTADRICHIVTRGFWTTGTVAAFTTTILAQGMAMRLRHGQFAVLADLRAAPIQAADTMPGVEALVRRSMALTSAPIVAVVGSTLAKLQAQRVLVAPNCRIFLDMAEAEACIDADWRKRPGR